MSNLCFEYWKEPCERDFGPNSISRAKFLFRLLKKFFAHFFRILSWDLKNRIQRPRINKNLASCIFLQSKFFFCPRRDWTDQRGLDYWRWWSHVISACKHAEERVVWKSYVGQVECWVQRGDDSGGLEFEYGGASYLAALHTLFDGLNECFLLEIQFEKPF